MTIQEMAEAFVASMFPGVPWENKDEFVRSVITLIEAENRESERIAKIHVALRTAKAIAARRTKP